MRGSMEGRPIGLAAEVGLTAQETADSISVTLPNRLFVRLATLILATADATGRRESLPGRGPLREESSSSAQARIQLRLNAC